MRTSSDQSSNRSKKVAPQMGRTGSAESEATYSDSKIQSRSDAVAGRTRKSAVRAGSPTRIQQDEPTDRIARGYWDEDSNADDNNEASFGPTRVESNNYGRPDGQAMQWGAEEDSANREEREPKRYSDENSDDDNNDDDLVIPLHHADTSRR